MTSEVKELVERLQSEPILDAGDGSFVELWEADFNTLLDTLQSQERRIGELLRALDPFGHAAKNAAISGRPPFEFVDANAYERARTLTTGGGHDGQP